MIQIVSLALHMKAVGAGHRSQCALTADSPMASLINASFRDGPEGEFMARSLDKWLDFLAQKSPFEVSIACETGDVFGFYFSRGAGSSPILIWPDQTTIITDAGIDNNTWYGGKEFVVSDLSPDKIPMAMPLDEARAELHRTLLEILDVSQFNQEGHHSWHFENGLKAIEMDVPTDEGIRKIAPPGVCTETEIQALWAIFSAWPFGGMGSWMDGGPSDPGLYDRYRSATQRLYESYCQVVTTICTSQA